MLLLSFDPQATLLQGGLSLITFLHCFVRSSMWVGLLLLSWAPFVELGSAGKESTCNVGDLCSIPGLGRSPGEGKGYPLQYSGLKNSMDCRVHGVAKSWTRLSDFSLSLCVSCLRGGLPNSRRLEVLLGESGKSLYLCGQRLCSLLQGETRILPIFFSIWCIWTVVLEKTLESPLDWRSNQSILKEISPEYSLERLTLKLKL